MLHSIRNELSRSISDEIADLKRQQQQDAQGEAIYKKWRNGVEPVVFYADDIPYYTTETTEDNKIAQTFGIWVCDYCDSHNDGGLECRNCGANMPRENTRMKAGRYHDSAEP